MKNKLFALIKVRRVTLCAPPPCKKNPAREGLTCPTTVRRAAFIALAFISILNLQLSVFAQGSLTPTAPPGPTMKTLQQIEPRTPISSLPYTITNSGGSYYLTTNLTCTACHTGSPGILIAANSVTLDLMGFELVGISGSADGVSTLGSVTNIVVRNGTVRGWDFSGVYFSLANSSALEDLRATANLSDGLVVGHGGRILRCTADSNGSDGISAGAASVVRECTATFNAGNGFSGLRNGAIRDCTARFNQNDGISADIVATISGCTAEFNSVEGISATGDATVLGCNSSFNGRHGFFVQDNSTVKDCTAALNGTGVSGGDGIDAGSRATVIHCTAVRNKGDGIVAGTECLVSGCNGSSNTVLSSIGIQTGDHSTVSGCTASGNGGKGIVAGDSCTIGGCTVDFNGTGIATGSRATLNGCTANRNHSDGISAGGGSFITGNNVSNNGNAGTTAGIRTTGTGSRIDGNHVRGNTGTGILAGSNDLIIRNSAGNNTTNYNPNSGANFGPVQSAATATSPWANFSY